MRTLLDEVSFEYDLIKMCSVVNLLFILAGFFMLIFDRMYAGLIIVGLVDEVCLLALHQVFKHKNLKALYNPFETVGKQIIYIAICGFIMVLLLNHILNKESSPITLYLISSIVSLIIIHFFVRFAYGKEIIAAADFNAPNSMGHYNLLTFFKNEPEIIYITDADIQAPFYGLQCGEFEIIHENLRNKGKNYKTYPMLKYLLEHNKKFEDLTEDEFKLFENIKHFE